MVDVADPTPDVVGTEARVARLAILPFIAFYAAFDAIVGFATGLLIRQANGLSGAEQAAAPTSWDEMLARDESLAELRELPLGHGAWRVGPEAPWQTVDSLDLGHRGVSLRRSFEQTDDHEPRGGRGHIRPRGLATPLSPTRPVFFRVE